ncbi:dynein light chain roadblock-type 1-like [Rhopilema esculentum]|uniref:dynein light chain roadblock-type 1-like n=1 Tax=Rhopilema esculentum TaxID=499914 RepID=UPI0031E35E38|eukprot:gene13202-4018_t
MASMKFSSKRNSDEEQIVSFFTRQPKSAPDVEARLNRIKQHDGVLGVIVVNNEGIAIRTTLDNPTTQLYMLHCRQLIHLARHTVRDIDPTDDLNFFRMRSKKNELVVAPDQGYTIIVIQSCPGQN